MERSLRISSGNVTGYPVNRLTGNSSAGNVAEKQKEEVVEVDQTESNPGNSGSEASLHGRLAHKLYNKVTKW